MTLHKLSYNRPEPYDPPGGDPSIVFVREMVGYHSDRTSSNCYIDLATTRD